MRLTPDQLQTVLRTVARHAGAEAATDLFGSRLDDQACVGDLDLLVEAETPMPLLARARLQLDLETQLGLPVDVVVMGPGTPVSGFQQLARACGGHLRLPI
jgi:predicted nucleotidyltransferase